MHFFENFWKRPGFFKFHLKKPNFAQQFCPGKIGRPTLSERGRLANDATSSLYDQYLRCFLSIAWLVNHFSLIPIDCNNYWWRNVLFSRFLEMRDRSANGCTCFMNASDTFLAWICLYHDVGRKWVPKLFNIAFIIFPFKQHSQSIPVLNMTSLAIEEGCWIIQMHIFHPQIGGNRGFCRNKMLESCSLDSRPSIIWSAIPKITHCSIYFKTNKNNY